MSKYSRYFFFIFLFFVNIGDLFAQNTISGYLKDKSNNQYLIGGSVYISDLKRGDITDINGYYKIENVPNGTFLFEITNIGYKSFIQKITISDSHPILNFELSESPTELNEVVVTGVTRATEISLSPVIIKQVSIDYLQQNGSSNLIDALKNIPGVSQITTGASISKPTIRGLGYSRVISLVDGIKQEGQQWGDEHGIEIDEYSVERIEIIKGPGSLLYGSDGIAGVINFISPKAPPTGKIFTKLNTNYQTNNQLITNSISNAGNKKNIQWLARLTSKYASNFQNRADGRVLNSAFREYDGSVFLGINRDWGYSNISFASFNTKVGLVEGERDLNGKFTYEQLEEDGSVVSLPANDQDLSGYEIRIPNQSINHNRLAFNNYFKLTKGAIYFDLGIQKNKRKEFGNIISPKNAAIFFDLNTINYNFRYNFDLVKGWESTIGVGGMQQSNKNRGNEYIIPQYRFFDVGTYLFTQKNIKEKLIVSGGLRFDNRSIDSEKLNLPSPNSMNETVIKFLAFKKNFSSVSGSAGISLKLGEPSTIKFNLSRGFRAPNIAEMGSNGQHEGTFRYEIGNQQLKPEYSNQIDLGYFLNADHITFEFTPFINNITNYIYAQKLDNQGTIELEKGTSAFKFVQGNAQLNGAEIYLDMHPHPLDWLHIENSFSFVNAKQLHVPDSMKYLPNIPPAKYRIELKAEFNKLGHQFSNLYFKMACDFYFDQNRYFKAFETETFTPAYSLLNIGAGVSILGSKKTEILKISLNVENITDAKYQNHLNRLKYAPENVVTGKFGVFNMGRNLSFRTIFNF